MSSKRKETLLAAGFLMPVFIVYTVFLFVPLVNTAMYSLTKWNGVTEKVFIGIRNYFIMRIIGLHSKIPLSWW